MEGVLQIATAVAEPRPAARKTSRRLPGGRVLTTVRRPAGLDRADRQELLGDLAQASAAAFGRPMDDYWAARGNEFVESLDRLYVVRDSAGEPLAFTGYRALDLEGERILYFDATGSVPEAQREGLVPKAQSQAVVGELARRGGRRVHHVIRTRSPVAWRLTRRVCGAEATWPKPDRAAPPEVGRLACAVAERLGQRDALDPLTLRIPGAYAGLEGLYGEAARPTTGEPELDGHLDRLLGADDGLLVIGRIDLRTLARYVRGR